MKIQYYLKYYSKVGESLWISYRVCRDGTEFLRQEIPMFFLNKDFWMADLEIKLEKGDSLTYNYYLKNTNGEIVAEWGQDREITKFKPPVNTVTLIDTWNFAGEFENVFFTAPFQSVLLKQKETASKPKAPKLFTHLFRIKAPLVGSNERVCVIGSAPGLGQWSTDRPVLMNREDNWWVARVDLSGDALPVNYKYGIYNTSEEKFIKFEDGADRFLIAAAAADTVVVLQDGFIQLPNNGWKGAGTAIPVFSLRSKDSFGVGEFNDLKLLIDWAVKTKLKLVQILPINDTTANFSWTDSYPYAGISAFALHPIYIHLPSIGGKKYTDKIKGLKKNQKQLNELPELDYEQVMKSKIEALKELYEELYEECFASDDYKEFHAKNKHWLIPYAAFCYLRDKYGTPDFQLWQSDAVYDKAYIAKLFSLKSKTARQITFHLFVQYHLHLQLKEAADYAHKNGIVLKGDIPIGIYRYSCDAWTHPGLFNMEMQAGAPPDDFAVKGQNWGFPTYNWHKMEEDGFGWWRQRFEQMSNYFDAFRIDHILGFFRIWSIPMHAVEGIMGHFNPAIPVYRKEFDEQQIWFDYNRFCNPFITDDILNRVFGDRAAEVKLEFVIPNNVGGYDLGFAFQTQRQVEDHFNSMTQTEETNFLKQGLFDLISNVILFDATPVSGDEFHFRIAMEETLSFQFLDEENRNKLKALYVNYFFRRQDDFWKKEALHKLPALKASTNMLICGEDLGMVPHCVPDVMKQSGILSLEIQRMPKDPTTEFFHPAQAPYLSVVTPSTHDMSTIRGWWQEDQSRTQRFYNNILGRWGQAPYFCEPWINRDIILQHLYSPAIWSIFQLQDLFGSDSKIRREKPEEERINIPAIPKYYWRYRMHITLEDLLEEKEFNEALENQITESGRG